MVQKSANSFDMRELVAELPASHFGERIVARFSVTPVRHAYISV